MLEITTERRCMEVRLDGEVKRLPLEPTAAENRAMIDSMGVTVTFDADGNPIMPPMSTDSANGLAAWFEDYAARYLGESVHNAGGDMLTALKKEWDAQRAEEGEPAPGED